jgi:hypothetical protein
LSPFVLHNLLSVCFRGASATSNAIFVHPSSFANRLVSLDFYDTLDRQKELAFAFGELRLIQNPALPKQRGSAIQPSRFAPVAQLDRALPSEAGNRGSALQKLHQYINILS